MKNENLQRIIPGEAGNIQMRTERMSRMRAGVAWLDDKQRDVICKKVDQVLQKIEEALKSGNWKRRSKIGTQKPWYNLVEDWS